MIRTVRVTVYKGRANEVTLSLKERASDGTETDVNFGNVSRMILTLDPNADSPVEVDTQDDAAAIDFSTNGQVVFAIGQLSQIEAMDEGAYDARLTAIDGSGKPSELMNEDQDYRVVFLVRDTTEI